MLERYFELSCSSEERNLLFEKFGGLISTSTASDAKPKRSQSQKRDDGKKQPAVEINSAKDLLMALGNKERQAISDADIDQKLIEEHLEVAANCVRFLFHIRLEVGMKWRSTHSEFQQSPRKKKSANNVELMQHLSQLCSSSNPKRLYKLGALSGKGGYGSVYRAVTRKFFFRLWRFALC